MHAGSNHTPETRAKMSAASKAALADPAVRAKMDWLSPEQCEVLLAQLRRGDRVIDVANDWLITPSRVYSIAKEHGTSVSELRACATQRKAA